MIKVIFGLKSGDKIVFSLVLGRERGEGMMITHYFWESFIRVLSI